MMGKFTGTFSFRGNQKHNVPIDVLKGKQRFLLSYNTAKALGIVDHHILHITSTHEKLSMKYLMLFNGIGKLKDTEVKLHIDDIVTPVAQQPRRILFYIRQKGRSQVAQPQNKRDH